MTTPGSTGSDTTDTVLAEGKTKMIVRHPSKPNLVLVESKDDITAGDGARHDVMPGKGALSTRTTSNVFKLLNACGIPTAFMEQSSDNVFIAQKCDMIPLEVVVRRFACGSYLKRHPSIPHMHRFERPVVEFYLKTTGKKWGKHDLPCDDPLMRIGLVEKSAGLYDPKDPEFASGKAKPFLTIALNHVCSADKFPQMAEMAMQVFYILERAWQLADPMNPIKLVDFKLEFGITTDKKLVISDVVDNDSWRLWQKGTHLDKQVFRDSGNVPGLTALYTRVADYTDRFCLPRQQVIFMRTSETAQRQQINPEALLRWYCGGGVELCNSVHMHDARFTIRSAGDFAQIEHQINLAMENGSPVHTAVLIDHPLGVTGVHMQKGLPFVTCVNPYRESGDAPLIRYPQIVHWETAFNNALWLLSAANPLLYACLMMRGEEVIIS